MAGTKRRHKHLDSEEKQEEKQDPSVDGANGHSHGSDESQGSGSVVDEPIVMFCVQCRVIVGDSRSCVFGDSDLGIMTLTKTSKYIKTDLQPMTSKQGKDLGSTYLSLKCTNCKALVGRMYKTTPRELDIMRDLFTFDIDKVDSYQLNSDNQQCAEVDHEALLSFPKTQSILNQLRKMQSLMIIHDEKIRILEEKCVQPDARNTRIDSAKKKKKLNMD